MPVGLMRTKNSTLPRRRDDQFMAIFTACGSQFHSSLSVSLYIYIFVVPANPRIRIRLFSHTTLDHSKYERNRVRRAAHLKLNRFLVSVECENLDLILGLCRK